MATTSSRSATLALLRAQLRLARAFDASPHLKPLLSLPGPPRPSPPPSARQEEVLRVAAHYRRGLLLTAHQSSESSVGEPSALDEPPALAAGLYSPSPASCGSTLTSYVQRAYREAVAGLSSDIDADPRAKIDAGFHLLRELKQAADLDASLRASGDTVVPPLSDELLGGATAAAAGAALVEAPTLAPGVLLVEHPSLTSPGRALILVYDISRTVREGEEGGEEGGAAGGAAVDETKEEGKAAGEGEEEWLIRGYVVNRPFPRAAEAVTGIKGLGTFGKLTLFHGGMASDGRLSVLHRFASLEGAVPINEEMGCGLYVGGRVDTINTMIERGEAMPNDFKVITGTWEGKLVVRGRSVNPDTGAVEPDLDWPEAPLYLQAQGPRADALALLPAQFDTAGKFRDGKGLGVDDKVEGYNFARFWHQNAAWASAVSGLGAAAAREGEARGDASAAHRGKEVASWAGLHVAVAAYARAMAPLLPVDYLALVAGEESVEGREERERRAREDEEAGRREREREREREAAAASSKPPPKAASVWAAAAAKTAAAKE
jgi:hypothetical protein